MWRIEDGSENIEEGSLDFCHAPVIENQEKDVLWYSQYFLIEGSSFLLLTYSLTI